MRVARLLSGAPSDYFEQIAELHMAEIQHGILPLLGKGFLALLYRGLSSADRAGVWVALHEGHVIGFVAGCADTKRTMIAVICSLGMKLLLATGGAVASPLFLRKLSAMLSSSFHQSIGSAIRRDIPKAELLAICVERSTHGRGIGRLLVQALENELPAWGEIRAYHVRTNVQEPVSNVFYRSLGFEPAGTVSHHHLVLQIYVKSVSETPLASQIDRIGKY